MLEKLIIVDYTAGCGGEYLSNFISSHTDFYSSCPMVGDMQTVAGGIQKYFISAEIRYSNWDQLFNQYLLDFLKLCAAQQIKNVCVPYHLYKHPRHIQELLKIFPPTRFIKIGCDINNQLPKFDFIRKVLLTKFSKHNISKLKYYIEDFNQSQKNKVIQQLQSNNLLLLDIDLIKNNKPVNLQTRKERISTFLSNTNTAPTNDIEISYESMFTNFSQTRGCYDKLVNSLGIKPEYDKLELLLTRNRKNLLDLTQFIKNFEQEIELL